MIKRVVFLGFILLLAIFLAAEKAISKELTSDDFYRSLPGGNILKYHSRLHESIY